MDESDEEYIAPQHTAADTPSGVPSNEASQKNRWYRQMVFQSGPDRVA